MATIVTRAGKGSPLTNAEVDANFTNLNTEVAAAATTATWAGVTGKPATLAGYGITDAQPVDADLTAIAALAGTAGFLKKTAANTWALDTTAYITASSSITGNAATATALQTARTINGVSFNGSANVTVTTAGTGISVSGTAVSIAAAYSPNTSTELPAADLNTYQTAGFYHQTANADASTANNYPVAHAGSLLIQRAAGVTQQYQTYGTTDTELYFRSFYSTVWGGWRRVLTSSNYNSFSPTLTGTGASGTWGIGITGNAATVTNGLVSTGSYADPAWLTSVNYSKLTGTVPTWNQSTTGSAATLTTGRTIALTGDVTYTSGSFNGSANVTGTATLAASGVTAGTYTKVTVDAKGRVTTGAALAAGDVPTLNQSTTGNAATATTLQTARTINGVSFNGSANITVADSTKLPLSGGTLSGSLDVATNEAAMSQIYLRNDDTAGAGYATQAYFRLGVGGVVVGGLKTTLTALGGLSTKALYLTTEGDFPIAFGLNNSATPAMLLNTSGNFGIGATSIDCRLVVSDSANDLQMRVGSLTAGIDPIVRLQGKNVANTTNRYADIKLNADTGVLTLMAPHTTGPTIDALNIDSSGNLSANGNLSTVGTITAPTYYSSGTTYYMKPATGLSGTTAGSRFNDLRFDSLWQGVPAANGPILTYTLTSAGSGYVDGPHTGKVLSGGSGVYATFDFVVTGGVITTATLTERGSGFAVGDTISIAASVLGGTGSGGLITVNTVRSVDVSLYAAAPRIRLGSNDTSQAAGQEIGGIYFNTRDASAGGADDTAYLLAVAEGTSGGGGFEFWTSANGGTATRAFAIAGNNSVRFYDSASTFYHSFNSTLTANRALVFPDAAGTVALTSSSITGNAATATILQTARTINGVSFNGSANITVADATKLPLAGGALTGTLSTTAGVNLTRDSAAPDPYAPLSVTRGTASNFAYASFVRAGQVAWQMGINTGNSLIIGRGASGIDSVITTVQLTLDTASNLTVAGNITAPAFFYSSDQKLKTNIRPIENANELVEAIGGDLFSWIESGKEDAGLIAQKVQRVFPQGAESGDDGFLKVKISAIIGLLSAAVAENSREIAELKRKFDHA